MYLIKKNCRCILYLIPAKTRPYVAADKRHIWHKHAPKYRMLNETNLCSKMFAQIFLLQRLQSQET